MIVDKNQTKKPQQVIMVEGKEVNFSKIDGTQFKSCPVFNTFSIMGKKFSILIVRNMMAYKQTKFNELLNTIEGINAKTLSFRLKEMEKDGLVEKNVVEKNPVRVEYHLKEKGWALKPVITAMAEFSMNQCASAVFKDKKPRMFEDIKDDHPIMIFK